MGLDNLRPEIGQQQQHQPQQQRQQQEQQQQQQQQKEEEEQGERGADTQPDDTSPCMICTEEIPHRDIFRSPCPNKCLYCRSCLEQHYTLAFREEGMFPPRCCDEPISIDAATPFLPEQMIQTYCRRVLEYGTAGEHRIYCHVPTCSEFILSRATTTSKVATCTVCKAKTCILCKQAEHPGAEWCPKDDTTDAMLAFAKKAGWQQCYKCRSVVEQNQGCNHMTCRCGAEFCYNCGKGPWQSCSCQLWSERNLRIRQEMIANGQWPIFGGDGENNNALGAGLGLPPPPNAAGNFLDDPQDFVDAPRVPPQPLARRPARLPPPFAVLHQHPPPIPPPPWGRMRRPHLPLRALFRPDREQQGRPNIRQRPDDLLNDGRQQPRPAEHQPVPVPIPGRAQHPYWQRVQRERQQQNHLVQAVREIARFHIERQQPPPRIENPELANEHGQDLRQPDQQQQQPQQPLNPPEQTIPTRQPPGPGQRENWEPAAARRRDLWRRTEEYLAAVRPELVPPVPQPVRIGGDWPQLPRVYQREWQPRLDVEDVEAIAEMEAARRRRRRRRQGERERRERIERQEEQQQPTLQVANPVDDEAGDEEEAESDNIRTRQSLHPEARIQDRRQQRLQQQQALRHQEQLVTTARLDLENRQRQERMPQPPGERDDIAERSRLADQLQILERHRRPAQPTQQQQYLREREHQQFLRDLHVRLPEDVELPPPGGAEESTAAVRQDGQEQEQEQPTRRGRREPDLRLHQLVRRLMMAPADQTRGGDADQERPTQRPGDRDRNRNRNNNNCTHPARFRHRDAGGVCENCGGTNVWFLLECAHCGILVCERCRRAIMRPRE